MGLRDEIIESQKARADLFKWKIILVAAIGAAVLGVGDPLAGGKAAGQAGRTISSASGNICCAWFRWCASTPTSFALI